jgi:hypothetical protein
LAAATCCAVVLATCSPRSSSRPTD